MNNCRYNQDAQNDKFPTKLSGKMNLLLFYIMDLPKVLQYHSGHPGCNISQTIYLILYDKA